MRLTLAQLAPPAAGPTIDLGDLSGPAPVEPSPGPTRQTVRALLTAAVMLLVTFGVAPSAPGIALLGQPLWTGSGSLAGYALGSTGVMMSEPGGRSEERRVGKECRSRWSPYH